jgi:hypothetical protein
MTQYLLSVMQPDGPAPEPEVLAPVMAAVDELDAEMRAAGVWVFAGGLHDASTATVLRAHDDDVLVTDGPYLEGKEHLGGFTILDVPDLDVALDWGRRVARAVGLPIEVRPFRFVQGR